MNKLIILIGLINLSMFSQVNIDKNKDSLEILKLQFKSKDTLTLKQLKRRILIYDNTIKIAENFNVSGIEDSAIWYYEKAHEMFKNESSTKYSIKRMDLIKNLPYDPASCNPKGAILRVRAELAEATTVAEAGYYFKALKLILKDYEYNPTYMIEKRKKILKIIELSKK